MTKRKEGISRVSPKQGHDVRVGRAEEEEGESVGLFFIASPSHF